MSKAVTGYFDDAHRELQRVQSDPTLRKSPAPLSNVGLPKLGPGGGTGDASPSSIKPVDGAFLLGPGGDGGKSLGAIFTHEMITNGLQADRFQQAIQESAKLARRLRAMQDQLSITTAKKEAFKAQAQRLEKEFKKGREQSDQLQKELLESRREAGQYSKEAQEAVQMMTEMRNAHIKEVKLLQRGLANRSGESRNKVNEVADLVDKVGRAVVQRDEATRDRLSMQRQLTKTATDLKFVSEECHRLKKKNKQLSDNLSEALRRSKFAPPRPGGTSSSTTTGGGAPAPKRDPDGDSDQEFEFELATFEKRFQILEEGPAGLDILASNLSKDKHNLEKRVKAQQETIESLKQMVESWKTVAAGKDQQIEGLNLKVDRMLKEQEQLNESIAQKRREIEVQVEEETAILQQRIADLEMERDNALNSADGVERVGTRLTSELMRVHQQYSSGQPIHEDGGEDKKILLSREQVAKTGETLNLTLRELKGDKLELKATILPDGKEKAIPVDPAVRAELDEKDPWGDLFSRVGVSSGKKKDVVISSIVGQKSVTVNDREVVLTIYRYDNVRYFFSGVEMPTTSLVDLTVMDKEITGALKGKINACEGNSGALFDLLAGGLRFEADKLAFNSKAAVQAAA